MPQIAAAVDYVCQKKGGEGAVREIVEMILEAQGQVSGFKFPIQVQENVHRVGNSEHGSSQTRTSNLTRRNHLYPVIMAGGSGTRFWPLSRQLFPNNCCGLWG